MKKAFILFSAVLLLLCSCATAHTVETLPEVVEAVPEVVETVETERKVVETEAIHTEEGYLTKSGERVPDETVESYTQLTDLPTLYLTLPSRTGGLRVVRHGEYTDAVYTYIDGDTTNSYYELPLQIKGRGNYSWSFEQKPYTLKLGEKADLAGMGEAKKWVLVSVHSDKTMLRNYLTQKCAKWLGLPGTCDNEYVDVMANGKYVGTYVLTEKVQLHENRIDVAKSKGVLFEIEMVYRHTCELCIVMYEDRDDPSSSIHLRFKEYRGTDVEGMTEEERTAALEEFGQFFSDVEAAMKSGSMEELERYIDVASFVDWYLLNELTRNHDSKFVTSCYCFTGNDGRLYMGPCWDYDTCYGAQFADTEGAWVREAPWYRWLFEYNEPFVEAVRERWAELRTGESDISAWFERSIDETVAHIAESEKLEHELYPHSEFMDVQYSAAVKYLKRWLNYRILWMDKEFVA